MTSSEILNSVNGSPSPVHGRSYQNDLSDNSLFAQHEQLVDWVLRNEGYMHPNVELAYQPSKGYHMVVADGKKIKPQTRIVSCPVSCSLSVLNVLNIAPFSDHGTKFPRQYLHNNVARPELLQAFYLMEQKMLGDQSWWAPYIKTLPSVEDINALQFDSPDDRQWLEGTNLQSGWADLTLKWRSLYEKGLQELKVLNWTNAINGAFSWDLYRWAATIFGSRGFSSVVLSDTTPSELARLGGHHGVKEAPYVKELFTERFSVLLPLLDVLNHKPLAKVEWQPRTAFVGLQVLEPYEAGQELCNNYGPRDNESLLLSYGFIIPDNPFDHVLLSISPPPGTLLDIVRSWTPDQRSSPDRKPYLLEVNHHKGHSASCFESSVFGFDLLDAVSVLSANEREAQAMYNAKKTLVSFGLASPHNFDDFRNFLGIFGQLELKCRAGASRLKSTYPTQPPVTPKQQTGKAYRDIQYRIYSTAAAVCRYILLRAHMDGTLDDSRVLAVLQQDLSPEAYVNLQAQLVRHTPITYPNELLSVDGFLSMLPQDYLEELQDTMKNIPKRSNDSSGARQAETSTQGHFAFLISAAYHFYSRGTRLPKRLSLWIEKIIAWYPPDDPNWSYVPEPGPWEPGTEPPQGLVALLEARDEFVGERNGSPNPEGYIRWHWLKRPSLCWGWNVMHEETIQVSKEITELASTSGADTDPGPMRYLLYVNAH
ncbi:uncharacterized protein HMPREF1541_07445 [Cyphellophora europaea CBS 101466]|uniref:SET domain-containing protein n=1 Tax=Cyphellophora europaea (strain CBS 101466) TaxID=1220924 RepID=W2RMY2_CYPE1|nr:uncharacterized protein HMPREF1541_07445 [Cyphellophora europaea CBS 101466]ETN37822.1 hypothetical protein HMPREF1541_07445 [Cyphellophora europaea CBS 101466]